MNYPEKIKTTYDVRLFFRYMLQERIGLAFHPDDDFSDYINVKEDKKTFSEEEAIKLNGIMTQCFEKCESESTDIYEIAYQELRLYVLKDFEKTKNK